MKNLQSLYHLWSESGVTVYNAQNVVVGSTTEYKAIAHNGRCIGSIEIDTGEERAWISGLGLKTEDGIKWLQPGPQGRKYFLTKGVIFCVAIELSNEKNKI